MMVLVTALLAATPTVGVTVGKRSGTSLKTALQRAEWVRDAALPQGPRPAITDASDCAGKRACLVAFARSQGVSLLVDVETATVLGDPVVSVVLLSIDEDGKALAQVLIESTEAALQAAISRGIGPIADELSNQLEVPVAPRPALEPVVVTPPPPSPPPVVEAPALKPGKPAARWIPLIVSATATVIGAGLFGASQGAANDLRFKTFDSESAIERTVAFGTWAEPAGLVTLAVGATASVASLLVAVLWPEAPVSAGPTLGGGAAIVWSGAFP
jgi:hypothetical protein